MIVLDTHIWIWWVHADPRLSQAHRDALRAHEGSRLGISAISCWEVAKLVERKRLELPLSTREWLDTALAYPGIHLLPLTSQIAVESTELPGDFHKDPADQIIVATAHVLGVPLVTADTNISRYPHVTLL